MKHFLFLSFLLLLFCGQAQANLTQLTGLDLVSNKNFTAQATATQKGLVIVFLSSKCPCSNSHVLEVKALAEKFKDFAFVGVHSNADEDPETSAGYFKNIGFPFAILQDKKSAYADELKANKTPHAFILAPDGKILYRGGVSNSANGPQATRLYLREALEDITNGKTLRNTETRTLGCAIAREGQNGWQ